MAFTIAPFILTVFICQDQAATNCHQYLKAYQSESFCGIDAQNVLMEAQNRGGESTVIAYCSTGKQAESESNYSRYDNLPYSD